MNLAQKMASEAVKRQRGKTHSCSTCVMVRFFVTPRWRGEEGYKMSSSINRKGKNSNTVRTMVFNREILEKARFHGLTQNHINSFEILRMHLTIYSVYCTQIQLCALCTVHCVLYTDQTMCIVYCTQIKLCAMCTVHCTVHRSNYVQCVLYTD